MSEESLLAAAIEHERWDLAALCLLFGMVKAAESLPPDAVAELLELLSAEPAPRQSGRKRRRSGCRARRA